MSLTNLEIYDNSTFIYENFTWFENNSSFMNNISQIKFKNDNTKLLPSSSWLNNGKIQIPLYTIILLLAIVGNLMVISTLMKNYRMRTITNLFLLNLAFSDILLGVFCMPFTLVGTLLRDFVFGEYLCKLIPFLQATSVSVSSWTLVAISCERYYAICHPLRSRSWQTIRHAQNIICFIWFGSFLCMLPIAGFSQLLPTNQGSRKKCREQWPLNTIYSTEKAYNIFLDIILLVLPLILLSAAYFLIIKTLYFGIKNEKYSKNNKSETFNISLMVNCKSCSIEENDRNNFENKICDQYLGSPLRRTYPREQETSFLHHTTSIKNKLQNDYKQNKVTTGQCTPVFGKHFESILRRSNSKNLENKQRVIRMLFVLVLEFFICWTPLYVINTITLFDPMLIYQNLGYTGITYFQLLAYSSSCCNPITYCFMNASFRIAFLDTFKGLQVWKLYCHIQRWFRFTSIKNRATVSSTNEC